ncbi:MAG: TerB family tellurite resistance protein [Candidatus Tenebribacter davisii]|nr:TerB family tellurite resistance protein [Candidatus Tenebribacter davisii]
MRVTVITTHIWTKVFVPIVWISRLAFLGLCMFSFASFLDLININNTIINVIELLLIIVVFIGSLVVHSMYIEQFYHTIQTYLYVVINLRTKINFQEAKYLKLLFAPSELNQWYPMKGIKDLPKENRRQALFYSARNIYKDIGHYPTEPKNLQGETNNREYSVNNLDNIIEGFSDLVAMLYLLSKADNHISKEEIEVIDSFFNNVLKLTDDQYKLAIEYFNNTRTYNTAFEVYARNFLSYHQNNKELLEAVCTILTNIALSDGVLSSEEEILLNEAIYIFNVSGYAYNEYKAKQKQQKVRKSEIEKKYAKILGLDDEYSYEEIKKAYRRLALSYHPDKVSHLGVRMQKVAELEMKNINEAYNFFKVKYEKQNSNSAN